MITAYQPFMDRLIHKYEGGYGWNRKDPGGPTKYGITCYALAEHRGQKMTSMAKWEPAVRDMTLEEAEAIYRVKYAGHIRFDDLAVGPDCCMLDYGVNSGPARPIHVARAIVRVPGPDTMDQLLLDAINRYDPARFVKAMCVERLTFMHQIRGGSAWAEFGHGWQARVDDVQAYCNQIIAGALVSPAPDLSTVAQPKAINVPQTAAGLTGSGAAGTAFAAYEYGLPIWAIGSIAAGVFAVGVGYEIWQARKADALNRAVTLPRFS